MKKKKRRERKIVAGKMSSQKGRLYAKLHDIYHDLGREGAYNNNPITLANLVRKQGFPTASVKDVKDFLTSEQSYTVHRRFNKVDFPRRHIRVHGGGSRVDIDLIELGDLKQWNDGYTYILVAIDAFSKFVWTTPLKRKESRQCAEAFEEMITEAKLRATQLYSDAGKEFMGEPFQQVIRRHKMKHRICTSEEFHCPFVERVNRTLKEKLFQAMTSRLTRRWIDLLPGVVETYNQTRHSVVGMRPLDAAKPENILEVYRNTMKRYPKREKKVKYKFKKGDLVRIYKGSQGALASKGYLPRYTWEIFRIRKLANSLPYSNGKKAIPAYVLEDLNGEVIEHALFYEAELSRVNPAQLDESYPIREIINQRTDKNGVQWVQVWWQGGEKKNAEWIEKKKVLAGKSI